MSQETNFLDRSLTLLRNGYTVVAIKPNEKRPGLDGWQQIEPTEAQVRKWAANGFAHGNIGINTRFNPAIDIDVYNAEMAEKMEAWLLSEFGETPVRVGQAPKRLLVYCCAEPFRKMFATYKDQEGRKHKIEVLGDGQQFVAYGIHPDTKKPFEWMSLDTPLDTPADMIPMLTPEMAQRALAKYGEFARAAGWEFVGSSEGGGTAMVKDADDALATLKPTLKLTMEEIEHALGFIDPDEGYDRWLAVGMALHHQSRGREKGLDVWDAWSSTSIEYDPAELRRKWKSFDDVQSRKVVTFASILKVAHEREEVAKKEEFTRALNVLRTCTDEAEIFGPIAKQLAASVTADYQLDIVAKKMQDRVFEITEVRPRIETVRKALAAATSKGELLDANSAPEWCKGWVYLKNGDRFYHVDSKSELTEKGFNAVYDREVLSNEDKMLGVAVPSSRASALALNLYGLPTVDNTVYLPGFDKLVELNGKLCANTFDETSVPEAREPTTREEREAIETLERHFELLFEDEFERNMVLDFLAYNVQFPAEKIVWAIVMQGAEGGGKTLLYKLLARVMGPQNVGPLSATELQDKYTGWAEGRKMVFIEEIRLHGSNRYEVLDKMKTYVSNEEVTVRRMNRDSYDIPNVTNYVMFTNYWDALPFSRMDRRYYVVATSFQTKEQLDEFNAKNPNYFANLYNAVRDHGDVLRWWLLTRVFSDAFQPKRPAVESTAKYKMRDQSESSDESDALNDLLEASTDPEVSYKLLNADRLKAALDNANVMVPYGRAFNALLSKAGFHFLGRFRTEPSKPPVRFYTRQPHLFRKGHELTAIRELQSGASNLLAFDDVEKDPFA